jgi:dienelactone hydrolase
VPTAIACSALLAAAGCGGAGGSGSSATAPATAPAKAAAPRTAPAPPRAPRPPAGRAVRFASSDGVALRGTFVAGRGRRAPGVVLVHEYQGGPDQFEPLVPYLHAAGFATLRYASRSAGELDERVLARDAAGAVRALRRRPGVDPARVAVLGSSIGATTAAWAIGTKPALRLRAAVGLSPAESPALIKAGTQGRFHPHDLLLIADRAEIVNARNIRQDAGGRGVTTLVADTTGHGVELLPSAKVVQAVVVWLGTHVKAPA